jgi:D-sedoheptulose 7-phosphate isomerase
MKNTNVQRAEIELDVIATYVGEVIEALHALDLNAVRNVVDRLLEAWQRDATIFVVGNGGSASTASHMMNDLCKFTSVPGLPRFRVIALTDSVPLLTAIANDVSYDEVFVEPLRNLMRTGDVVLAISGSGNSPNVVNAAAYALKNGASVIGLCGTPGGLLASLASWSVLIPAAHIGQQEDGHLIVNHAIAAALRARLLSFAAAQEAMSV